MTELESFFFNDVEEAPLRTFDLNCPECDNPIKVIARVDEENFDLRLEEGIVARVGCEHKLGHDYLDDWIRTILQEEHDLNNPPEPEIDEELFF